LGAEVNPNQKRILCMNKVDLVENKKDLLQVAKEFEDLPGFERYHLSALEFTSPSILHMPD
jgi:GTPase Era involved in 16S rRNA processing